MTTKTELLKRGGMLSLPLLVAFVPANALAHGGPPSPLGILAVRDDGPEVVLLNEGLALKRPQGWSYLCPSLWGEPDTASGKFPLARSADGIDIWLPGGDDLYLLRDQQLIAQQRPELRRNTMIALTNDATHVYGLHYTGVGEYQSSEVVRVSSEIESTFWRSDVYWSAITANERGVYAARIVAGNEMELVSLDPQGQESARSRAVLPLTPWEMQLQALGDRIYLTANDGKTWLVGYFAADAWTEVVQESQAIIGPQASPDGTEWLAVGGTLLRLQGGAREPIGEMRMITCLEQWNDLHYACVGSDLHRLTEAGVGDRIFGLDGFKATDPELVPPDQKASCDLQWILYSSDAMRSGLTFTSWPNTTGNTSAVEVPLAGAGASVPAPQATASEPATPPQSTNGCSVCADTLSGRTNATRTSTGALFCSVIASVLYWRFGRRQLR